MVHRASEKKKKQNKTKKKKRKIFQSLMNIHVTHQNILFYFLLSLRAGGILQILQSDWFREWAVFYDLAC